MGSSKFEIRTNFIMNILQKPICPKNVRVQSCCRNCSGKDMKLGTAEMFESKMIDLNNLQMLTLLP